MADVDPRVSMSRRQLGGLVGGSAFVFFVVLFFMSIVVPAACLVWFLLFA